MRITIVQGAFLPVPALRGGAVEKRWYRLAKAFADRGHAVTQISRWCDGLATEEMDQGVYHRRVRGFDTPRSLIHLKMLDLLYSLRVQRVMAQSDVVITNTFWLPMLLRRPSEQGQVVVDFARMPKGQVRFYKHVACIRVNSEAVRQAVVSECASIEPKVRLISNPLPFDPPGEVDMNAKRKVLLYAGRIHPEKGLMLLLQAWRGLSGLFPDWHLEIAGAHSIKEGGGGEAYLRELQSISPQGRVIWHGPVHDDSKLKKLYEQASLFVYPSVAEQGETFGLAVLEAMAYGAVPVVSQLDCFNAFMQNDRYGAVFNHRGEGAAHRLSMALEKLMKDGGARHRLAYAAVERAKAFAPDKIADQFLALFNELCQSKG